MPSPVRLAAADWVWAALSPSLRPLKEKTSTPPWTLGNRIGLCTKPLNTGLGRCNLSAMLVGERIRAMREAKNLSQGDIEHRSGLLRCYTSRIENGHTVPSVETLEKFARAGGSDLSAFLRWECASKGTPTGWAPEG